MSVTADKRYGRQGGRWLPDKPPRDLPDNYQRPPPIDFARLFHPETIARSRAHDRRRPGSCASDRGAQAHGKRQPCDCPIDPDDLDEVWGGVARMARARRTAGLPLNPIAQEAIAR
jgi:hypothetical protein